MQGPQAVFAHEARHTMLATSFPGLPKVQKDARGTVNAVAGIERRSNQPQQPRVFLSAHRYWALKPRVKAAPRNSENLAHYLNTVLFPVRFDEFINVPCAAGAPLVGHGACSQDEF